MQKKRSQFKAILRKDLKLIFTWKTILVTVFVPFIMMFLVISLPTIFMGSVKTTITVCSDDLGSIEQHMNGTLFNINLGTIAIANMKLSFQNISSLEIKEVQTRGEALNASNGIYFPSNFSTVTFDGMPKIEFRQTASAISIQGAYFDQMKVLIQETINGVFLFLKNITQGDIPQLEEVIYIPPAGEPETGWSQDTLDIASPYAYAMFILITLVGSMGRTIGFAKEKEDGTFETMLSITKNRANLVYSKLIIGLIASLLSILSYFAGSAIAGYIGVKLMGETGEDLSAANFLALSIEDLISIKGFLLLIGLGFGLVITMLALMTVDTLFSKTVAERIGISVVVGLGILFYFTVTFDPGTTLFIAQINPFYWIYHFILSIIDLSFGWLDAIYMILVIGLLIGMIFIARKSIEREKVLFT